MTRPLPDALKAEILDNVPVIIAFHDRDQKVVWGNKAYQKAIGLSLPEIEGRRCHSVWGLAKPCRHCPVARAIQTGEPGEAELTPEHPEDGPVTRGAWLSKAVPLKDEDGNLIGIVETVHDITEHKRVEQVRHESEQHYRTLFETMAQGVVYQTAEGHISAANPAAKRILGLSLDQMRGKTSIDPAWQSIHEDGSPFPGADHPSMVALRTGETVAGVVMGVYHPHSDEHRWLMIDAVPEFLPGERKPHSVYTTFTDITAHKRADEEIRKFRTIADKATYGVAITDLDGNITYANETFARMHGWEPAELAGRHLAIFHSEEGM